MVDSVFFFYSVQFSISMSLNLPRCLILFVTRVSPFAKAVAPMSKSKSSTMIPFFLNLAFSFAKMSMQLKIGTTVNFGINSLIIFQLYSFRSLFSAPNFNSATVISEIKFGAENSERKEYN